MMLKPINEEKLFTTYQQGILRFLLVRGFCGFGISFLIVNILLGMAQQVVFTRNMVINMLLITFVTSALVSVFAWHLLGWHVNTRRAHPVPTKQDGIQ